MAEVAAAAVAAVAVAVAPITATRMAARAEAEALEVVAVAAAKVVRRWKYMTVARCFDGLREAVLMKSRNHSILSRFARVWSQRSMASAFRSWVGMVVERGLVLMSDTRTNSGVDNISVFSKMFHWNVPGERIITVMTAGNLATTQHVIGQLEERTKAPDERENTLFEAPTMFQVASDVGKLLRSTISERQAANGNSGKGKFTASIIVAGQIAGMAGAFGNVGAVTFLTVNSMVDYDMFFLVIGIIAAIVFALVVFVLEEPEGQIAETLPDGTVQMIDVK